MGVGVKVGVAPGVPTTLGVAARSVIAGVLVAKPPTAVASSAGVSVGGWVGLRSGAGVSVGARVGIGVRVGAAVLLGAGVAEGTARAMVPVGAATVPPSGTA